MRLSDLIEASASAGLSLQREDGSFPPGRNGPYGDPETPIRNTAHWLVTLLAAHRLSGQREFSDAAARAAANLLARDARPMGATFLCRTNPAKDFANGLIGQAWVIESLAEVHRASGDPQAQTVASDVFLLHPFSTDRGLWWRVNVDGSLHTFDPTFNHQLWFAAAGALLDPSGRTEIGERVVGFLDHAATGTLVVRPGGRIRHAAGPDRWRTLLSSLVRGLIHPAPRFRERRSLATKEVGYHAFNLYAFALLYRWRPSHPLWRSTRFRRALGYVARGKLDGALSNPFGGPYNPVGFEVALAVETFQELVSTPLGSGATWIERQLEHTFDAGTFLMTKNTPDPETLAARFYEVTRLRGTELEIEPNA